MKKSSTLWISALILTALSSVYLSSVVLPISVPIFDTALYVALAFGLLGTFPLWQAAFNREKSYQALLSVCALTTFFGYVLVSQNPELYWQPSATAAVLNLGGWILTRQTSFVYSAERKLTKLVPSEASVIDGVEIRHVATSELEVGQVILVRPGITIPCDGYVIQGQSLVDQGAITGESAMLKVPGDWVLAGSQNLPGRSSEHAALTIRVAAVGDDLLVNTLDNSVDLENGEPIRFQAFSKIAASLLTISVIAAALIVSGTILVTTGNFDVAAHYAFGIMLSAQVIVISYTPPYAAIASSIRGAALGFVVRSRKSFEALSRVNHVVLGKTGVLTVGHKQVGKIHLARNTSIGSEDELLALAASVEMGTSHELGHLIIQEAARRSLELPRVEDIAPLPGLGISARFDGSLVQVGNAGMVNVSGVTMNPYDLFMVSSAYSEGSSVVFVSVDELLVGYIEFPDEVRPNSQSAIVSLSKKHAITVLSGDATALVEKITQSLGLSDFAAEVLSTRKADWIKERQASGSKILLVADGQYDSAALTQADVAIAFGAGHDIHQASCDLIQISQDPLATAKLVELSKQTQERSLLNIIAGLVLSLALAGLVVLGVYPVVVSAIGVVSTWLLLRRVVRLVK